MRTNVKAVVIIIGFFVTGNLVSQTLRITSPATSVRWTAGEYHAITWTGVAGSSIVQLKYSTDGGDNWIGITDSARDNSYIWKIPKVNSRYCHIKALARADSIISLTGHSSLINTGSYSNNGLMVATASDDGTAKVWNPSTGEILKTYKGHTSDVMFATFSPDDSKLLTASSDKTARIWDVQTGALLFTLTGHTAGLNYCGFSPDGALIVTASEDGTARLWNSATGEYLKALHGHASGLYSAFFHPDGSKVITSSRDNTVMIWDLQTGAVLKTIQHPDVVHWASWSSDGTSIVTACRDARAYIYDGQTYLFRVALFGHTSWVWSAEYSKDGKYIVTGGRDGTAKVWSASSYSLLRDFAVSSSDVGAARFSPDGKCVLTASNDQVARVRYLDGRQPLTCRTDSLFTIIDPSVGVETEQPQAELLELKASPIPVTDKATFRCNELERLGGRIEVLNELGVRVGEASVLQDGVATWNSNSVSSGRYFAILRTIGLSRVLPFIVQH